MTDDVADETWVTRMQALPAGELADLLAGAVKLLQRPEAISDPLESELRVYAEQACLALGTSLRA